MSSAATPLTTARVLRVWWPLAASWMLMGAELPLLSAFVARMTDPEVHLAAYASVVFPVSLVVEAPIIMLLAASTALSRDWDSYRKLYRFTMVSGAWLTLVHIALAFTPLFDLVVIGWIDPPAAVVEPARIGLRIMTPWTWTIAYRRFHQGVLIRFGRSRTVGVGTLVRLVAVVGVLLAGSAHGGLSGIVVGASAIAAGVTAEAIYAGIVVRPVLRGELREAPPASEPVTRASFLRFYVPLAMTPLLTLLIQPLGAAAMARMPWALPSLAAWPVVYGLVFLFRSVGFAYNEVVVSLLDEPDAVPVLRRFGWWMAGLTVAGLYLLSATPLSRIWLEDVSGLEPPLAAIAALGMAVAVLMPGYAAMQSWYQGRLVHAKRTRAITEAVVLYLVIAAAGLEAGVSWNAIPGMFFTLGVFTVAGIAQTAWLAWRTGTLARNP